MNNFTKKGIYTLGVSMFSLGYYRGCQQYYYNEIKQKNITPGIKEFMMTNIMGIMNGSIYVNPSLTSFAVYEEYIKHKIRNNEKFDEKLYYKNTYLEIYKDK